MNRTSLLSMIAAMTLTTAVLDYSTSAQLAIPVLFAFPMVLCAGRRSKKLLWCTAGIAVAQSVAAGIWGFHRAAVPSPWLAAVNRGLIIDSLLGITVLLHLWINKSQKATLEAAKAERQRISLIDRNEQLETALAKIKSSKQGKRKPLTLTIKQYQALAEQLSDLHRTMVVTAMCSDMSIAEVLALKWEQVDLENGIIYPHPVGADRGMNKSEENPEGVSVDPVLREALAEWRNKGSHTGLMFASHATGRGYQPEPLQKDYLRPAARKCGLTAVSWNTFPRSYNAWIAHEGTASVHRKLMRPAQLASTMNRRAPLKLKGSPGGKIAPRAVTAADFPVGVSAGAP
ncbi:MAG: site-specific integrase [Acidobacteriaceae bacterium]